MGIKLVTPSNVSEKDVEIELRLEPDEDNALIVRAYKDGEWIPAPHVCGFTVVDGKIRMETYGLLNKKYFHVEGGGQYIDIRPAR